MRGKKEFLGKATAELGRGVLVYSRYTAWLLGDIFQWPFWIIFFFLSVLVYSPASLADKAVVTNFSFSFFTFIFVSSFIWASSSLNQEAQQGIVENLILTNTPLSIHLFARMVITSIDILVGGVILLTLSHLFFGAELAIARPLHFIAALAIAFVFFLLFTSVLSAVLLAFKSPWLIVSLLQFIIPFSSGALPVDLLHPDVANIVSASPFFYVIHPIVGSATGRYFIPEHILFTAAIISTILMAILAVYVEKQLIRKALKKGRLGMF
ncbi:MAG: hypothetical protein QXF45_02530 [Candidatus Caldarchaeum sp.]